MPANKKHHYVPRFYLKRFSINGRSIQLFNIRATRVVANANLKGQCYRDYMYGKELDLEFNLAQLEGAFADLTRKVIEWVALPPPLSEDHENLAIFVVLQYARTAYSADALDEFADGMWKRVLSHHRDVTPQMLEKVRIVYTEPGRAAVGYFLRLYHLIMDMHCRLLLAPAGGEFVTSDNPVILYNQLMESERFGGSTGLASKGLQIILPLSPTHALLMFDHGVYAVEPKNKRIVQLSSKEDLAQINLLQVASAQENVYFSNHAAADIYRVVERGKRFRRKLKTKITVFPQERTGAGESELIANSREQLRTGLALSFVRVIKPAKRWRDERNKQRLKPATVIRNLEYFRVHERFLSLVDSGHYQPTEFLRYLRESDAC